MKHNRPVPQETLSFSIMRGLKGGFYRAFCVLICVLLVACENEANYSLKKLAREQQDIDTFKREHNDLKGQLTKNLLINFDVGGLLTKLDSTGQQTDAVVKRLFNVLKLGEPSVENQVLVSEWLAQIKQKSSGEQWSYAESQLTLAWMLSVLGEEAKGYSLFCLRNSGISRLSDEDPQKLDLMLSKGYLYKQLGYPFHAEVVANEVVGLSKESELNEGLLLRASVLLSMDNTSKQEAGEEDLELFLEQADQLHLNNSLTQSAWLTYHIYKENLPEAISYVSELKQGCNPIEQKTLEELQEYLETRSTWNPLNAIYDRVFFMLALKHYAFANVQERLLK